MEQITIQVQGRSEKLVNDLTRRIRRSLEEVGVQLEDRPQPAFPLIGIFRGVFRSTIFAEAEAEE